MTLLAQRSAPSDELDEIAALARPLAATADLDPLLDRVGDARFVLLGEASHGTSEYYGWRAALTRRLVAERGFSFVAVEGDWPDCFALNRWVKGRDDSAAARDVLGRFDRWPAWMWANEEVAAFAGWLRGHNLRAGAAVGFYGLDVYSLWEALRRVFDYLGERHPDALDAARRASRCFEPYAEDPQRYAWATRLVPDSCEAEVAALLGEMHAARRLAADDDPEAELDALQNAEVLAGAERYHRAMVRADGESWNVRDCHMVDTLDRLVAHHGRDAKAVGWAHNTHVGDARATGMAAAGMVNVGQLVRERHARDGVVIVGFGGHRGSVVAADAWGAPLRRLPVPPAPHGTHEDLLHRVAPSRRCSSSPSGATRRGSPRGAAIAPSASSTTRTATRAATGCRAFSAGVTTRSARSARRPRCARCTARPRGRPASTRRTPGASDGAGSQEEEAMQNDEFVGHVQHRARLASRGDAERAIRATLSTLAARLDPGLAGNLAAQLPSEIAHHLTDNAPPSTAAVAKIGLDEFFAQVAECEGPGTDEPQAVFHARCVIEVVAEAVDPGLIDRLVSTLPDDWSRLFTAGSAGRMSGG